MLPLEVGPSSGATLDPAVRIALTGGAKRRSGLGARLPAVAGATRVAGRTTAGFGAGIAVVRRRPGGQICDAVEGAP